MDLEIVRKIGAASAVIQVLYQTKPCSEEQREPEGKAFSLPVNL